MQNSLNKAVPFKSEFRFLCNDPQNSKHIIEILRKMEFTNIQDTRSTAPFDVSGQQKFRDEESRQKILDDLHKLCKDYVQEIKSVKILYSA